MLSRTLIATFAVMCGCVAPGAQDMQSDEPTAPGTDGTDSTDSTAALPACARPLAGMLTPPAGVMPAADSLAYQPPRDEEMNALSQSLAAAQAARFDDAVDAADQAGYDLCRTRDDGAVMVWTPRDEAAGHARIAFRDRTATGLVLEVPHPSFEIDTREEGILVFERLGARALIIAGGHRCATPDVPAGCDGTTSVCGGSRQYAISDMAHTEDSAFHTAHLTVSEMFTEDLVVSLHGMAGDGVRVSNGTRLATTSASTVGRTTSALSRAFPTQLVQTCNAFPGASTTSSLCGTTNVQGRHLNGADRACVQAADRSVNPRPFPY